MRFLNPAGLWLLLGIPVLIIIYLIKAQHEERAVSSTYIWKLSSRFAKKRLPIQRLRRIILFILQLLMIVLAAMMASKPVMVKGESYDYVIILDGSASMQTQNEKGKSRFEIAVKEIEELAKDLSDGHTMTVILATDSASVLIENSESAGEVKVALKKAVCYGAGCNTEDALALAQTACDRSDNAKVLFYTDSAYEKAGNITIVDMNKKEWNVSLTELTVQEKAENTVFTGHLISYNKDAEVTVGLAIDGKTVDAKLIKCEKDTEATVVFEKTKMKSFDTAEIYIEAKDGLALDNCMAVCQKNRVKYKVLVASESALYLERALTSLGNCDVTVVSSLEDVVLYGMDLYVFDGIMPDEYPTDGSVVVFGTEHLPEGLRQGALHDTQGRLMPNGELATDFYDGLTFYGAVVKEYVGLVGNHEWEYLLYCNSAPVLACRKMENGVSFAVFSFDLHDSNLPMLSDYPVLMRNLVQYCIPSLLGNTDYTVGESVQIAVLPTTTELHLRYPDGTAKALYTGEELCTVRPDAVGVYTVVMKTDDGGKYADFFVHIPKDEMALTVKGAINIAITEKEETVSKDAVTGIWFWFALAFLLILLIEWEWYYYEQY